ncbi:MAG: carboxypeptidase-like regulatory domain-containing protein, partial [Acidobacteriaceae bacterium]
MTFSALFPDVFRPEVRRASFLAALAICLSSFLLSSKLAIAAPVQQRTVTGTVTGTVTDPLGAAVYNARVDIMAPNGVMLQSHGRTDGRGQYIVYVYRPGRYRVRVIANGFNATQSNDIYVEMNKTSYADVALQFGHLEQSVTVTANGTPTPEAQSG